MPASSSSLSTVPIEDVRVGAFRIPTDAPESDGTLQWDSTTLVVVELRAGGERGLGYTYADAGVADMIVSHLEPVLGNANAIDIPRLWHTMFARLRNLGQAGASSMAVSAVDVALWDLNARLRDVPLVALLGRMRDALPLYGSGGFTSYSDAQLQRQFREWADLGVTRFKMKVGREPAHDRNRVKVARAVIGDAAQLFVDANSAYTRNQALEFARIFVDEADVRWFEQPLAPADLEGLHFLRGRVPPRLEIADGEYAYSLDAFRRFLEAGAVDVMMADATRCGGITGFMKAAALCEAWMLPMSSHCAPALHLHPGCAAAPLRHAEYFHDHVRIERDLFDGAPDPRGGVLRPDLSRTGHGLEFKWSDAEQFSV
ncbi:MAG TPA: enolase C-terminal domain-like protein [Opitutus sp.]|nr:enolase C-terminal domain-like protein [Opitutus sp.]